MHLHLMASPSVTIPRMLESGVEVGYTVVGLKFSNVSPIKYIVQFQNMLPYLVTW